MVVQLDVTGCGRRTWQPSPPFAVTENLPGLWVWCERAELTGPLGLVPSRSQGSSGKVGGAKPAARAVAAGNIEPITRAAVAAGKAEAAVGGATVAGRRSSRSGHSWTWNQSSNWKSNSTIFCALKRPFRVSTVSKFTPIYSLLSANMHH